MTKRIIQYAFIATLIAVGYLVFSVIVEPLHRAKAQSNPPMSAPEASPMAVITQSDLQEFDRITAERVPPAWSGAYIEWIRKLIAREAQMREARAKAAQPAMTSPMPVVPAPGALPAEPPK